MDDWMKYLSIKLTSGKWSASHLLMLMSEETRQIHKNYTENCDFIMMNMWGYVLITYNNNNKSCSLKKNLRT